MRREFSVIYVTARDEPEAARIAKALLDERLIACCNILPVRSLYKWKGRLEDEREVALVMKTRKEKVAAVIDRIKEIHSYEVPEIISFDIEKGNGEYLDWVWEGTK